jgi:hypothetical protein
MISNQTRIIGGIVSIVLFIVGLMCWGRIFAWLLPKAGDVVWQMEHLSDGFRSSLIFGLTLALIPVGAILLWKFAPINRPGKRAISICILLAGIVLSIYVRRELIEFVSVSPIPDIKMHVPVSQAKFDIYALAGLISGCAVAWLLLKEKRVQ